MDEQTARDKLALIDQSHLMNGWDELDGEQKSLLLNEIRLLDVNVYRWQRRLLKSYRQPDVGDWKDTPLHAYALAGNPETALEGRRLLEQGRMGCILVAGGQGSRLGYDGPKGCFPISNVKGKTLFQIFAEKTLCAGHLYGVPLSLAIMTSSGNHHQTVEFFREHHFFGLDSDQIDFFMQDDLPFLDRKGDMFLKSPDEIAKGPSGNGTALKFFFESGLWEKWDRKGIKYAGFIMVDNPLADPYDAELLGFHVCNGNQVTIKAVMRDDPAENIGVIVQSGDHLRVVEYTEIPEEERYARDRQGQLKHICGNISLFCLNMQFVHDLAIDDDEAMPYHLAFKSVEYLNDKGQTTVSAKPIAWKFEKFIFDILYRTREAGVLIYPKAACFAPLKNKEGSNSRDTVQSALLEYERNLWREVAGTEPSKEVFELAQNFYYPTVELCEKWRGKEFPDTKYVNP